MEDEKKEEKGLGELLEEAARCAEEVVQQAIGKHEPVSASVAVGMKTAFEFAARMDVGDGVPPEVYAKLGAVLASTRAMEVVDRIFGDVFDKVENGSSDE